MRVAIMQPYLFPYWPYVQLMGCVDVFVLLDNVQFIRHGWMNRNRIRVAGKAHLFTLPVAAQPLSTRIHDIRFWDNLPATLTKLGRTLEQAYARRPRGATAGRLFQNTFAGYANREQLFLPVALAAHALLAEELSLPCRFLLASELGPRSHTDAVSNVIDLVRRVGGRTYINSIGGRGLYSAAAFEAAEIRLTFLNGRLTPYDQGDADFIPGLSVLDLFANLEVASLRARLSEYELVSASDERL